VPYAPRRAAAAAAGLAPEAPIAEPGRRAYFGPARGWLDTAIVNRSRLRTPQAGPCIVEEYDATCLVPPGWTARLDDHGNIAMQRS
jgi:N-methylhydantoinase A